MNKIVDDCFSTTLVSGALTEDVECLKKTFNVTEISKTLKNAYNYETSRV
jgi:hypothetical protein